MSKNECYALVIQRDHERCFCGDVAVDVHHIVPRSHFGKNTRHKANEEKNLICLCRKHHDQAQTKRMRTWLLRYLERRFHYSYEDEPWHQALVAGEDSELLATKSMGNSTGS